MFKFKKVLPLLMLSLAVGCTKNSLHEEASDSYEPKYRVGQCVVWTVHKNPEKWEKQEYVAVKILDVGAKKYHAQRLDSFCTSARFSSDSLCFESMEFRSFEYIYDRVATQCP